MLPWLIGAAAVATVGYLASGDDDDDDRERRERRRERERDRREERARNRERARERATTEAEIESFKEVSEEQINNKYGVKISCTDAKITINDSDSKIEKLGEHISESENKNKNMQNLITNLQEAKNEI